MSRAPKVLVSIGDCWVDPVAVIAIDSQFEADAPAWANVRVVLSTGQVVFGLRAPERVTQAVRHPEQEREDDEADEQYPDPRQLAAARARRRRVRLSEVPHTHTPPVP